MRALVPIAMCAALAACGVGGDVKEDGHYVFLPGSRVVDTAPYPLEHLIVVEDDAQSARAYVYLFSGQLGRASVGLPDLRRVELQNRGFQMKFETPRALYADAPIESRGLPLQARFGTLAFELARLDDDGLARSGATRWLGTTQSGDYEVRAYFAVVPHDEPLGELVIETDDDPLGFEPALMAETVRTRIKDDALWVGFTSESAAADAGVELDGGGDAGTDAGTDAGVLALVTSADYVLVDLWQPIEPVDARDDDAGPLPAETEAIVRFRLAAGSQYAAPRSLITDAAGQGCWSAERPLQIRAAQLFRRYLPRSGGDLAVIHQRMDGAQVATRTWTKLLDEPTRPDYCKSYR